MTKPFTYLSVCSGIEAASVAWEPLGWRPAGFAEIDPFACHVLAHRQAVPYSALYQPCPGSKLWIAAARPSVSGPRSAS